MQKDILILPQSKAFAQESSWEQQIPLQPQPLLHYCLYLGKLLTVYRKYIFPYIEVPIFQIWIQ